MIAALMLTWIPNAYAATDDAATTSQEQPALAAHPNPLLSIDQNRNTVVDRVVDEWGDALEAAHAGIDKAQLRTLLEGLRADQLLAASLAGSLEGLRNVIANALTMSAPVAPGLARAKVLGDATVDLVYTPVTPCRILDSRFSTGGALKTGQVRNWLAANPGGNFGTQGGAAANCGILIKPAAVVINFTVANTTGAANFLTAWPFNDARPGASALNWTAPGQQIANAVVVPLCSGAGCTSDFSTYASAQTDLIGDVLGYFAPPAGAISGGGTANYLAKWGPRGNQLGNSQVFEKNGFVGIGTAAPAFALDVSVPSSNTIINLVNGVNAAAARIARYTNRLEISPDDALQVSIGGVNVPNFWIGANGNVGIGNTAPLNKLQIGLPPGFSGNDLAFGNSVQGSGFAHVNGVAQWASSTNIALMPFSNGKGNVGINTTTPGYPLEVQNYVPTGAVPSTYFAYGSTLNLDSLSFPASIFSQDYVIASGFAAQSDARIKHVAGTSDATRDLATLRQLRVTDYTMKDVAAFGARPFKKLIAQEVEAVYPQVVSRARGFVPDVYQIVRAAETEAGVVLHFEQPHHLGAAAKRLKVAAGSHPMIQVGVKAIPSPFDVLVEPITLAGDKVFVYGEEVEDFRTIDYEGLTALNISATQEIAKQQADLAALVVDKDAQIADLRGRLAKQESRIAELEALAGDMSELRAELAALKRNAAPAPWRDAALHP